ncbi:MAG: hypothetical protein J6C87_08985 [Bacteroides sp.]|nr:hypothetical protein [Bacteroides sp.]
MKKKIFFAVATIVAAVSVGYAAYLNQKVEISDALLENIEALSDDENEDVCKWQRVEDEHGVPFHVCVNTGTGDECKCGEVDY